MAEVKDFREDLETPEQISDRIREKEESNDLAHELHNIAKELHRMNKILGLMGGRI